MIAAIAASAFVTVLFLVLGLLEPVGVSHRVGTRPHPRARIILTQRWARLEAWLTQACLPLPPAQFALMAAAGLAALLILGTLWLNWQTGLVIALLGLLLLRVWVVRRIHTRGRYVAEELPPFLRLVVGRLRTGFSLLQALEAASVEGPPLLAAEMQRVIQEVNMGATLEDSLGRMAARLGHEDIDLVVTTMLIGREIGGNLTRTLEALADTVTQRSRLRRQVRVLTAQPRLSGIILALLPFILLAIITVINPAFTGILLRHPMGWLVIGIGVVSQGIGVLIIRRILRAGEDLLT